MNNINVLFHDQAFLFVVGVCICLLEYHVVNEKIEISAFQVALELKLWWVMQFIYSCFGSALKDKWSILDQNSLWLERVN